MHDDKNQELDNNNYNNDLNTNNNSGYLTPTAQKKKKNYN